MTRHRDFGRLGRYRRSNPEADRRARENDLAIQGLMKLLERPNVTDDLRGTIFFHIERLQEGGRAGKSLLQDVLAYARRGGAGLSAKAKAKSDRKARRRSRVRRSRVERRRRREGESS